MNSHKSYVNKEGEYICDYPNRKIGKGNPYYKCVYCGVSDPEINGQLSNHASHCSWAMKKFEEIKSASS